MSVVDISRFRYNNLRCPKPGHLNELAGPTTSLGLRPKALPNNTKKPHAAQNDVCGESENGTNTRPMGSKLTAPRTLPMKQ